MKQKIKKKMVGFLNKNWEYLCLDVRRERNEEVARRRRGLVADAPKSIWSKIFPILPLPIIPLHKIYEKYYRYVVHWKTTSSHKLAELEDPNNLSWFELVNKTFALYEPNVTKARNRDHWGQASQLFQSLWQKLWEIYFWHTKSWKIWTDCLRLLCPQEHIKSYFKFYRESVLTTLLLISVNHTRWQIIAELFFKSQLWLIFETLEF